METSEGTYEAPLLEPWSMDILRTVPKILFLHFFEFHFSLGRQGCNVAYRFMISRWQLHLNYTSTPVDGMPSPDSVVLISRARLREGQPLHVDEVNTWLWNVGCLHPRVGCLTVTTTAMIRRKAGPSSHCGLGKLDMTGSWRDDVIGLFLVHAAHFLLLKKTRFYILDSHPPCSVLCYCPPDVHFYWSWNSWLLDIPLK